MTKERACGTRDQGGLYIAIKQTLVGGYPIDYFVKDPAIEWEGSSVLRSPQIFQDTNENHHLILGIGKTNYPYPSDYIEETRKMGISRKIPRDFDFSKLEAGKSKLFIMHPRAIPEFEYETESICFGKRKGRINPEIPQSFSLRNKKAIEEELVNNKDLDHKCLGATYPLSLLENTEKHEVTLGDDRWGNVKLPSDMEYNIPLPKTVKGKKDLEQVKKSKLSWKPGIIIKFPSWHLEFIDSEGRKPEELEERVEEQGFDLEVCPE